MESVKYFFWLFESIWSSFCYAWPISVPVSLFIFVAIFINKPFRKDVFKTKYLLLLIPFLLPIFILVLGTVFVNETNDIFQANKLAQYIVVLLFFLHLPLGIFLVYSFKGIRFFTISINLFQMWLSFLSWFVAGMSISGDWL